MGFESLSDLLGRVEVRADLKIGLEQVFRNETMSFNVGVVPLEVPDHYHKISDEMYFVHEGKGRMRLGDEHRDVAEGDFISIPRGTVHGLVKTGGARMVIFIITSPPFDPEHDRFTV
ncbi:MAG: cupin domain-containing protein [Spirochaetes bacterium]|nr:cupin domain-containing protein [Spirochaetota bacterium]